MKRLLGSFTGTRRRESLKTVTWLLFFVISVLSLALVSGCGGGGGGGYGGGGGNNGGGGQLSTISGTLMSKITGQPLVGITVGIQGTNAGNVSDGNGNFQIANVAVGQQTLVFLDALGNQEATDTLAIVGPNDNLGTLTLNIEGNPPTKPGL
jgi:hypothetical protein